MPDSTLSESEKVCHRKPAGNLRDKMLVRLCLHSGPRQLQSGLGTLNVMTERGQAKTSGERRGYDGEEFSDHRNH